MKDVSTTIDKVETAKKDKEKELEAFVENYKEKLEQQKKSKLLTLLTQKATMADEIESLEDFHQSLNK